jgi:hypothetical protein|tara:strand:- start:293 stop:466 length:174 start_codon:yes stop_codon:yes gene_type:complete
MKKRVNITIPEEVWTWASSYSKMNYTSLSGLITSLLVEKKNEYKPVTKNVLRANSGR